MKLTSKSIIVALYFTQKRKNWQQQNNLTSFSGQTDITLFSLLLSKTYHKTRLTVLGTSAVVTKRRSRFHNTIVHKKNNIFHIKKPITRGLKMKLVQTNLHPRLWEVTSAKLLKPETKLNKILETTKWRVLTVSRFNKGHWKPNYLWLHYYL